MTTKKVYDGYVDWLLDVYLSSTHLYDHWYEKE